MAHTQKINEKYNLCYNYNYFENLLYERVLSLNCKESLFNSYLFLT